MRRGRIWMMCRKQEGDAKTARDAWKGKDPEAMKRLYVNFGKKKADGGKEEKKDDDDALWKKHNEV